MGRFPLGAEKVPVLPRNTRILAREMLTESGIKGKVLGEGGWGNSPRKRPGYSSSRFYRGEKLQISASLVVCRTERTINSC